MDCRSATRNVAGLIEANPDLARAGIELRKFGLQVIEGLAEERVASLVDRAWRREVADDVTVRESPAGGDSRRHRHRMLRLSSLFKSKADAFREEIENFGSAPTRVRGAGRRRWATTQLYDGLLRFRSAGGGILEEWHRQRTVCDLHRRGDVA